MVSAVWFAVLVGVVALERLAELVVAKRNCAWSLARGVARPAAATTRSWSRCTPDCWPAACSRSWLGTARSCPRSAGRCSCSWSASQALRWWCIRTLGPPVEHPDHRRARPGAGDRRARTGCSATRTTSRSSSRASRCRWCTPHGSPRWCSPCSTPACCTVRIRTENAALPSSGVMRDLLDRRRGPAGARPSHLRRGRAGLDVAVVRAAPRPDRQGLRRGADARRACARWPPRRRPARPRHPRHHATCEGSRRGHGDFRCGPGRGVRRTALHARALDAVAAAGIPVLQRRSPRSSQHADHVRRPASALATWSPPTACTRRSGGSSDSRAPPRRPPRWGLRRHFAMRAVDRPRRGALGAACRGVCHAGRPDTVGIAILTSTAAAFDEQLPRVSRAGRAVVGGRRRVRRSAVPGRCGSGCRRRVAGRVLLVGDAAGYVDALTGEGIALSLAAAAELVACLVADRPAGYERAWSRVSRRSRWLTSGLLWARGRPASRGRSCRSPLDCPACSARPRARSTGRLSDQR